MIKGYILAVFLFSVLAFSFLTGRAQLTGFAVAGDPIVQQFDTTLTESQMIPLVSDQPFTLTSLRISGAVAGGRAQILLSDGDRKYVIYRNTKPLLIPNRLTGFVTGGLLREQVITGPFSNACEDTCFLHETVLPEKPHVMVVMLEPGATLTLTSLTYSVN